MNRACALVLLVVLSNAGCSWMSFQTRGTVELLREDGSADVVPFVAHTSRRPSEVLNIACWTTFWLAGGACWLYALGPGEDTIDEVESSYAGAITRAAPCARTVTATTKFYAWYGLHTDMAVKAKSTKVYALNELDRLCTEGGYVDAIEAVGVVGDDEAVAFETTPASPTAPPATTTAIDPVALGADPTACTDGVACLEAALLFEEGHGVARDVDVARRLYERGCALKHAPACLNLGVLSSSGKLGVRDEARAVALYAEACALDAAVGCGDLAGRFLIGMGTAVDIDAAEAAAVRGCDVGNDAGACRALGRVAARQGRFEVATYAFERACAAGLGEGCKEHGDLLAATNDGMRAIVAYRKAVPLLQASCANERAPIACSALADIYERGLGVTVSTSKAAELRAIACTSSPRYCAPQ